MTSKDFLPDLQEHVCRRMEASLRRDYPERFVEGDTSQPFDKSYASAVDGRLYIHKTAHLSYSAYDGRKGDDIVWPSCDKANIMLLNPQHSTAGSHPFIYGKVLGIYHINVVYVKGFQDLPPRRLDLLWVRWYRWHGMSAENRGLDTVAFPPVTEPGSFGFIDPGDVLRACHIVPRFPGRPPAPAESLSRKAQDAADYPTYFVNRYVKEVAMFRLLSYVELRFADRDMFMRYHWGYSVGHCYSHGVTLPPSLAVVPPVNSPARSANAASRTNQREEVEVDAADEDQPELPCNPADEMVFERSDVESSEEEEEDQDMDDPASDYEEE
jgi:hypothetical protein